MTNHQTGDDLPIVDVVLLSLDRPALTEAAAESALRQEGVSPRVIIVDQGSSEQQLRTLRELALHPQVELIELGENRGVPGGRNIGMRRGEAPYVVSIDNDAEFASPRDLLRVVERFQRHPEAAALTFRILNESGGDDETSWNHPPALKAVRDEEFTATTFVGCGHAIRRTAVTETGGYDDSLFFMWEEYDLSIRLINEGHAILYTPEVRILHKVSPEARVRWDGSRFYYLVRNALYLEYKFRGWSRGFFARVVGYVVKGALNRALGQAVRGVRDGIAMCWKAPADVRRGVFRLTPAAERYVAINDRAHRGGVVGRIRDQLLASLPGENSRRPEGRTRSTEV